MKKALLPLVIASMIPVATFADVVVYGKANVSLQNADEADDSTTELVSNASRIGVKGSEQINDGFKAIYQFEYQTEVDDGTNGTQTFGQRNIYVGLQGSGGTVMGGKFDTPVKVIQEKVDLFNDLEGDMSFLVDGETRANNIVQYTTPVFASGLALNLAHVSAENAALDDGMSASITYTGKSVFLAAATEQDVTAQGMDITRVVGRFNFGSLQLGLLFEQSSGETNDYDADAWLASLKYNVSDKWALKAQYGNATDEIVSNAVDIEGEDMQLNVGFDYLMSKNTMIFAYYTSETAEEESVEQSDNSWLGVGVEMKF